MVIYGYLGLMRLRLRSGLHLFRRKGQNRSFELTYNKMCVSSELSG